MTLKKIYLIQSSAMSYNTDILYLHEIFLDSFIEASDPNMNISGYNSLRSAFIKYQKRRYVYVL